jgi:hypothetical protein
MVSVLDRYAKYSAEYVKTIKCKIIAAWKRKIDKDGPPSADDRKDGEKAEGSRVVSAAATCTFDREAPGQIVYMPLASGRFVLVLMETPKKSEQLDVLGDCRGVAGVRFMSLLRNLSDP